MNLKSKIYLTTIISLTTVLTILGFSIYRIQKKSILNSVDQNMISQMEDFHILLSDQVKLKQEMVDISLNLAENIFESAGKLEITESKITVNGINQETKEEKSYEIPVWKLNGEELYNNFKVVDLIREKSVESATIFQKTEDGYLRISTNVMTSGGQRAVGTYIPNSSEVVRTIERGETYYGRAFVVDDWYLTAYHPVKVKDEIKGILYVGVREKNYAFLKEVFTGKKYYTKGYPFLIDTLGTLLIHPELEKQNMSKSAFFTQLKDAKGGEYKFRYRWPENTGGEWKYLYFKYFDPYDSYIAITLDEKEINAITTRMLIMIITSMFLTIVLLYFVLTKTLKPIIHKIIEATEFTTKVSEGDLTASIRVDGKDELGILIRSLQNMQGKLRDMVLRITSGADNILQTSHQLDASSRMISQGAAEQASSVEEISSTLEEFSMNMEQNTLSSRRTETMALNAVQGINRSNEASNIAVKSMNDIASKITIINDIAFQTNILALNAAVEAARAGDQGKGFAVVAAEVRKLAERSKVAADEIVHLTKLGVDSSEKTGQQLSEILPEVEKTSRLVVEITAASNEMNEGALQINSSIQHLNEIAQRNAAASEETAAGASELTRQAEVLKESVAFFKV